MRVIFAFMLASLISGCAATGGNLEPPRFNRSANALFADTYPLTQIYVPEKFEMIRYYNDADRTVFIFKGDSFQFFDIAYLSDEMNPNRASGPINGYSKTTIDGVDVYYKFHRGLYSDFISYSDLLQGGAPTCAIGMTFNFASQDSWGVIVAAYFEGRSCDDANNISDSDKAQIQSSAYEIFGLK